MNYNEVGKQIIRSVGGEENVASISHCYTRLRLTLKGESKVDTASLDRVEGVMKTIRSVGQFQIVLGNNVTKVYNAILADTSLKSADSAENRSSEPEKKKNPVGAVVDTIAGIFTPCIGIMAACGMIAGLLALAVQVGLVDNTSGTYQIFNALSNTAT